MVSAAGLDKDPWHLWLLGCRHARVQQAAPVTAEAPPLFPFRAGRPEAARRCSEQATRQAKMHVKRTPAQEKRYTRVQQAVLVAQALLAKKSPLSPFGARRREAARRCSEQAAPQNYLGKGRRQGTDSPCNTEKSSSSLRTARAASPSRRRRWV